MAFQNTAESGTYQHQPIEEYLLNHDTVDNETVSLQPRGLMNRKNYRYLKSILQALLACTHVYNLLSGLTEVNDVVKNKSIFSPIIDGLCRFVEEFKFSSGKTRANPQNLKCGSPFEPFRMRNVLNGTRSDPFLFEGRQEDAEEFLGCLLNGLYEESPSLMNNSVGEEGLSIGAIRKTPVSDIFGGPQSSGTTSTQDKLRAASTRVPYLLFYKMGKPG